MPNTENQESLQESREFIRHTISEFSDIMENNPHTWWRSTVKFLLNFRRELQKEPNPEIVSYFDTQISSLFDRLRIASHHIPTDTDDFASYADHLIMDFSMEIASKFEKKEFPVEEIFLSLNEIVANQPDRFKTENRNINGILCIVLNVKHPTQDYWQEIPLPKYNNVWHKGGPARAVLDIIAHAPISMQESEFPWHDFDALVGDKRTHREAARRIGVDADGIESMGEINLNFARYCAGRDTTQNQVCLGAEGIHFTQDAFNTAVTGHTRLENEYVANKAIYGFDKMIVQGESLAKPRGLMRMIKAVVEGKALSFDYLPLNAQLDLGTNILFLSKRWSKKDEFPQYLQRLFYLLKNMDQTRPDENNIFDVLERAHREYPFFDFDSEVRLPIEVVRWKAKKLIKQIDREMGWQFNIPSHLCITRVNGDSLPLRISLNDFVLDPNQLEIKEIWADYLNRSQKRTQVFLSQNLPPYDKIFHVGNDDCDDTNPYEN